MPVDALRGQPEKDCRFLVVAMRVVERTFEKSTLKFADHFRVGLRAGSLPIQQFLRKIFLKHDAGRTQDDRLFDDILKLPHIARPMIILEDRLRLWRNAFHLTSGLLAKPEYEKFGQCRNV